MRKNAFTLAEIAVVLTILGVLTAILLPIMRKSIPDEGLTKFHKAHAIFHKAISELVNSDKYYLNGDLGKKTDGELVDSPTYFCQTLANVLKTKTVTCSSLDEGYDKQHIHIAIENGTLNTDTQKTILDTQCKAFQKNEIIVKDNIVFYSVSPFHHFGTLETADDPTTRLFGNPGHWYYEATVDGDGNTSDTSNKYGLDVIYKIFCIDIDGINNGEDPFGYGIRADGKIISGTRAQEWIEKEITEEN